MMSVENADTAEAGDEGDTTDARFERELLALLRRLGETIEPWQLYPPETTADPAKLLVGAQEGVVRGRLEGAGYEVSEFEYPLERDGWIAAWEVSS